MKKSILASERGSVVEFALILPVLLTLILGIIEFGLIMCDKQVITNASREAARAGIVKKNPMVTDATIRDVVNGYTKDHLVTFAAKGGSPNTIIDHPVSPVTGDYLTVTVTYQYHFLALSSWIPGLDKSLQLTARSVMRYD